MKIQILTNRLIFWPETSAEEKILNGPMRNAFDKIDIMTDRCWSYDQIEKKKLLGIRVYFDVDLRKEKK